MIAADVRDAWAAFSTPLEGCISHLYLDTKGLVTVAIGCLVDSPGAAASLAGWDNPGGVVADWHRVKAMPAGLAASRYAGGPTLSPEGVQLVVASRLDQAGATLAHAFPDFYGWPPQAQAAALSLAWACGAGWPASWPRLSAFCRARDWTGAAGDCEIRWQDNPGVRPRDFAQRALFLLAANPLDIAEALEVRIPQLPAGDAAHKALAAFPFCQAAT